MLKILHPDYFTDSEPFEKAFELNSIAKDGNKSGIIIDEDLLSKAHYLMRVFVLQRTKEMVEKLMPPKTEIKVPCPLAPCQVLAV